MTPEQNEIKKLVVLDTLEVGPVLLEKRRMIAPYKVINKNRIETKEFIYSYEEDVFNPSDNSHLNIASVMAAQVALNYGLFFKKIIFRGLYDNADKSALKDWAENTSREIFVKKFLEPNPFLTGDVKSLKPVKLKNYLNASLEFPDTNPDPVKTKWEFWINDKSKHCILSSGGKDSLLSYGLINELGYDTHPIFVNESGRHWFTALNAYNYFKKNVKNTGRVWVNSDRVFSFMLRQLPFIRKDFANVRADEYPIRLWTVAVFLFGVMPLLRKRKIGRLIIGDEYDTTVRTNYKTITHYDGLYDQSRYFDDAMSRYFMRKGWSVSQFSILRPMSELLIETILAKRYPELQKEQVSCHAAHKEGNRIVPCGKCEKCRRIVGMLSAIDVNPENCGYGRKQIERCLTSLEVNPVHQEKAGAQQLNYMLFNKGLINPPRESAASLKENEEVLHLRFDSEKSPLSAIPNDIRKSLYIIYLQYARGALIRVSRKWISFDPINDPSADKNYPFEFSNKKNFYTEQSDQLLKSKYLWAELTWEEADKRLKQTNIAILPVGAIEQHGPHLPLDVDSYDADYLAKKVAEACSDPKPLVLPLIPYGVSYHHDDFPGTISVTNETLSRMVYEIGMSISKNGINKLIIINGHGDNSPTLNYAAQMINRDAKIFVAVDTGETSDVDLDDLSETPNDVHAGEIETSTTLALRPRLVKMDRAKKSVLSFSSRYLNFSSLRGVPWYARTKRISESGIMGDPTRASSEKGKQMWEIMIAHLVAFVEDLKNLSLDEIHQKKY
ncbi:MAG: creatininase family protein [Melioribacteraceae bacterium]|nr:creatininase family protein [Melioribacteraceae bacterium]